MLQLAFMTEKLTSYTPKQLFARKVIENMPDLPDPALFGQCLTATAELEQFDLLFDSSNGTSPHIFCVTENGYVGMVPRLTRVGDMVCLIYGCEVSYVLREEDEKYRLVGDAYVHRLMDGEGLRLERDEEDFALV